MVGEQSKIGRTKKTLWLGLALLVWPIIAAFLSGFLFAQGNLGMLVARVSYHVVSLLGTPSMLVGAGTVLWSVVLLRKQKRQLHANVNTNE
ncbi:MAG: hypothetical protein AAF496_14890 [Pseudomonadota bacterium]